MNDPGFVADVLASKGNEEAKALLRRLGVAQYPEVCEHDWHRTGTVNGQSEYGCQKCGKVRRENA